VNKRSTAELTAQIALRGRVPTRGRLGYEPASIKPGEEPIKEPRQALMPHQRRSGSFYGLIALLENHFAKKEDVYLPLHNEG